MISSPTSGSSSAPVPSPIIPNYRGILHSGGSTYTLRPSFLPDYDPAMTKGKPGKIWNCLATWMIRREISKNSAKGKGSLDPHTKGDLDQWKALKTSLDGHPPEYH
eukprot:gene17767-24143_t